MGLISKILSFTRTIKNGAKVSDVKVDRGGGDNATPEHFADPGDDSFPLPGDYASVLNVGKRSASVGYVDPVNIPKAGAGEKRIYARDPETGLVVVEIWLKNDGTGIMSNSAGSFTLNPDGSHKGINSAGFFELEAGGDFVVNGAKITSTGDFVDSSGKTLRLHTHPQGDDSDGNTEEETGVPS